MSGPKKLSAIARLGEITATPHPTIPTAHQSGEGIVRYTAEVPKSLHRSLKLFALNNEVSTYAVTNALLRLLETDDDFRSRVRSELGHE